MTQHKQVAVSEKQYPWETRELDAQATELKNKVKNY